MDSDNEDYAPTHYADAEDPADEEYQDTTGHYDEEDEDEDAYNLGHSRVIDYDATEDYPPGSRAERIGHDDNEENDTEQEQELLRQKQEYEQAHANRNFTRLPVDKEYVSVEYVSYVNDIDQARECLGGDKNIIKAFREDINIHLPEVKLRPKQVYSVGVQGATTNTGNMLLKITRRYRVRKSLKPVESREKESPPVTAIASTNTVMTTEDRASKRKDTAAASDSDSVDQEVEMLAAAVSKVTLADDFEFDEEHDQDDVASDAVQSSGTTFEILGIIPQTLRFRALADFQYVVGPENSASNVHSDMGAVNYLHLINARIGLGEEDDRVLNLVPPTFFTRAHESLNYRYKQNASAELIQDSSGRAFFRSRHKVPEEERTTKKFGRASRPKPDVDPHEDYGIY